MKYSMIREAWKERELKTTHSLQHQIEKSIDNKVHIIRRINKACGELTGTCIFLLGNDDEKQIIHLFTCLVP